MAPPSPFCVRAKEETSIHIGTEKGGGGGKEECDIWKQGAVFSHRVGGREREGGGETVFLFEGEEEECVLFFFSFPRTRMWENDDAGITLKINRSGSFSPLSLPPLWCQFMCHQKSGGGIGISPASAVAAVVVAAAILVE